MSGTGFESAPEEHIGDFPELMDKDLMGLPNCISHSLDASRLFGNILW